MAALEELAPTQGEQVLIHQDLHADNVLAAQREPWLVIDPKPLVGEREFSLAPIIRSVELGHSRRAVVERLDRLSSELGLDRERARGWATGSNNCVELRWRVPHEPRRDGALAGTSRLMALKAVLFDVDFTRSATPCCSSAAGPALTALEHLAR